jgi:DNA-directed RNA polymerase specialized sigma24 family protein
MGGVRSPVQPGDRDCDPADSHPVERKSRSVIEDLIQETYSKLCADQCRTMQQFEPNYPDATLGFVKVVAANVAHDHFRSRRSAKRGQSEMHVDLDVAVEPASTESPSDMELFESRTAALPAAKSRSEPTP